MKAIIYNDINLANKEINKLLIENANLRLVNEKLNILILNKSSELVEIKKALEEKTSKILSKEQLYLKNRDLEASITDYQMQLRKTKVDHELELDKKISNYKRILENLSDEKTKDKRKKDEERLFADYMKALEKQNAELELDKENLKKKFEKNLKTEQDQYDIKLSELRDRMMKLIYINKEKAHDSSGKNQLTANKKILLLQNKQLFIELNEQSRFCEELIHEMKQKDEIVFKLKNDLEIHKNVEYKIAEQYRLLEDRFRKLNVKIRYETLKNTYSTNFNDIDLNSKTVFDKELSQTRSKKVEEHQEKLTMFNKTFNNLCNIKGASTIKSKDIQFLEAEEKLKLSRDLSMNKKRRFDFSRTNWKRSEEINKSIKKYKKITIKNVSKRESISVGRPTLLLDKFYNTNFPNKSSTFKFL